MNKHDPLNRKCLQNCVVNRGARVSCAHLHHDCTCPAQKEDPFSEFMKSQGINVVDVTPTQKEEWVEEYDELPSSFYRAPSHRDDCEGLVAGDIGLPCTCTTQKEEWDEEFRKRWSGNVMNGPLSAVIDAIIADMHRQISLAEARGREEANKCDECGGTDVVCAKGVMDSIRLARTETITAFEEWAGKYMTETTKYYGTDKHGIDPDDLLSFASFLKSNAPKV